ncbi:DNA repair metallo-beta-lactamase-domain-containing protein [Amanita rubescens]|nr:DNA repair metallo-beta-lactamase-domain-containing protein [Amanita rubescens]
MPANSKNAFSVLMSSFRESESWQEASIMEDRSIRSTKNNRRNAPFYKVLQGMPIAVDAFRYGKIPNVNAYFLTHAHADHYTNLSSSWQKGPIYCSEETANLIIHMLSVDKKWANHCPGSCLFFFEGPQTVDAGDSKYKSPYIGTSRIFRYLHCGDFRASPRHVLHPAVKGKRIDHVYLDTTYLDPKYTFPPQPLVISACADLAKRISDGESTAKKSGVDAWLVKNGTKQSKAIDNLRTLTYSVGKERILKAIAHALRSKVYCDSRKTALLRFHVLPLAMIASDRLKAYLQKFQGHFDNAVGFRPTGWTYAQAAGADQMPSIATVLSRVPHRDYSYLDLQPSRQSTKTLQIYPVPYSEHSSFFELTCFAMSFSWVRMIATVNVGSESSRRKMSQWVSRWETERKKRGSDTVVPCRHPDYW